MSSRSSRPATGVSSRSVSSMMGIGPAATAQPSNGRSRPRTAGTSSAHEDEILCAVSEGRGMAPTIGLAFVNLSTCESVLCQFADTQTYARTCHKIRVFDPTEILVAETAVNSKMVSILKENIKGETQDPVFVNLNRRYWNEGIGQDYLHQLAFPDDLESLKLSLIGQYFAVCCFAAVLRYMDLGLTRNFAPQTLRIKFEPSEGAMMIDTLTIASLELVQNLQNAKSKDCLFGLLNQTLTRMGARFLKSNILQPSTDKIKISKRYRAVAELSMKEVMFSSVREALQGFIDTDKALAAIVLIQDRVDFGFMESSVNNIIMLKTFVDSIRPIHQALTGAESEELNNIRALCDLDNYVEIQELINYALNVDCKYSTQAADLRNQRVFAIQAGVNGFLDVARTTYKEINEDIDHASLELDQYQLNIQLKFDPARQFYYRIKETELDDQGLPEVFINVIRKKTWIECQTLDLMKMNQRLKDAHAEVISLSNTSIQKLIDMVRTKVHPLFKISEGIALLDMLAAFGQLVATQSYTQPELLQETLGVKSARHPICEKISSYKFIPNDVYATPQTRFQIITGCNMSGKSTYIRSIALMTVMAQIGCFVPAEYACFPIVHQLFARVSTDDSIEANVSTFASEMREMAFILRTIEPQSLVIVDELGRGTSTIDGLAIAIAISEALIESKAYVWFVTHFRDLPQILSERAGVVSLHLAVDMAPDLSRMKMSYKIAPGNEEQKFYGLTIARLMDLPRQVHEVAAEVSQYLNDRNEARKSSTNALAVAKRRKLVLALDEQIKLVRGSERDNDSLRLYCKTLQEEFVIRMSAIDAEIVVGSTIATEPAGSSRRSSVVPAGAGDHVADPIEVSTDQSSPMSTSSDLSIMNIVDGPGPAMLTRQFEKPALSYHGRELSEDRIEDN